MALAPQVFGCDPLDRTEHAARGKGVTVAYSWVSGPPAVGELATLRLRLCDISGAPAGGKLSVDAVMPAHGHGMNYTPPTVEVADEPVAVTGLLFHMPGRWQLRFKLRGDGVTRRAHADFLLAH
ncbi:MAG: hypothetical protein AAF458_18975 [Pseudomonadota bacterium]